MSRHLHPDHHVALGEVREVYKDLETRPVQRNCTLITECCQFKRTGETPYLTRGEAMIAAKAIRAAGRKEMPKREDGSCPMLHQHTGKCIIYKDRPFGCRTHFCEAAGGPYTRREVLDLIRRLEVVDAQLGGCGAMSLEPAIAGALRDMD